MTELLPGELVDVGEMDLLPGWAHQRLEALDDVPCFDEDGSDRARAVGVMVGSLEVEGDEAPDVRPVGGHQSESMREERA